MKNKTERLNKIKEGLRLLKEAGVIAGVTADAIRLEIVTENISVSYQTDKSLKIKLEEEGTELDLTDYVRLKNIYFVGGLPILNFEMFPKKLVMYPEKVKRKYGE